HFITYIISILKSMISTLLSPSINLNTLEIISFACFVLLDTQQNPITELCHTSFKSISAMEILNLDCNFPIILFMVCRLSFNELTSYILSLTSQAPIIKLITSLSLQYIY